MPSMGADMENGVLVQWNYAVGDHVNKGDIICEIETAKGNVDVEVWESGTIKELRVQPGEKIPVGDVMALLDTGKTQPAVEVEAAPEPVSAASVPTAPVAQVAAEDAPARPAPPQMSQARGPAGELASPAARQRARELGVDLTAVRGSGPDGVIKLEDVEAAAQPHHRVTPVARKMAAAAGIEADAIEGTGPHEAVTKADVARELEKREPKPKSDLRAAIAAAMSKSKREIPHYYLASTVDVTATLAWLEEANKARSLSERLVLGALLARAVALAVAKVPEMNGTYVDDAFRPAESAHVGFAVAMRGGGVVAPALHDVQAMSLDATMAAIKDLVARVRGGKLRASELTDSTITITSLGDLGVDTVFGVIYPPQVAIVGFGSPAARVVAHDGMIAIRRCIDVTLSGDHRVSDGLSGAKFLNLVAELLQKPEEL